LRKTRQKYHVFLDEPLRRNEQDADARCKHKLVNS
jgi:hypothetical protein